jgi:hypothetical protein
MTNTEEKKTLSYFVSTKHFQKVLDEKELHCKTVSGSVKFDRDMLGWVKKSG